MSPLPCPHSKHLSLALFTGLATIQAQAMDPGKPLPRVETKGDSKGDSKGDTKASSAGLALADVEKLPAVTRLKPRAGQVVPVPPFSLKGLVEDRRMSAETARQWGTLLAAPIPARDREEWLKRLQEPGQAQLPARRYAIFHGIGFSSLRRLLECYYDQVDRMGDEQLVSLAPWVVLGLRHAVSGTLIDVTEPATWYPVGFLVDVPLECFWKTSSHDAMLPMEKHPLDQKEFRSRFEFRNYTREQNRAFSRAIQAYLAEHDDADVAAVADRLAPAFEQDNKIAVPRTFGPEGRSSIQAPQDLFQDDHGRKRLGTNEVGFFARVEDPGAAIRITAVVLTSSGKYGMDPKNDKGIAHYEKLARDLAKALGLPLYDLRLKKQ